jgi:hypothetical protein
LLQPDLWKHPDRSRDNRPTWIAPSRGFDSLAHILGAAYTLLEGVSQPGFRQCVALRSSLGIPGARRNTVLPDTRAVPQAIGIGGLRGSVSLFRGLAVPFRPLYQIGLHSGSAVEKAFAGLKFILGGLSLRGCETRSEQAGNYGHAQDHAAYDGRLDSRPQVSIDAMVPFVCRPFPAEFHGCLQRGKSFRILLLSLSLMDLKEEFPGQFPSLEARTLTIAWLFFFETQLK